MLVIKCKICDKEMKSFRMVSHLKFKHPEYTVEKYIEKFGEFREKIIQKQNKILNNKTIKCQLCDSIETIKSFRSHLRWKHPEYNSEKYVEKFGEFRPKQLKYQNNYQFNCEICHEPLMHNRQLMHHIKKKHQDVTQSEYIIKYMFNNQPQLCKCGCGGEVKILTNGKNCDLKKETFFRDYIKGHWDWEVFSNIGNKSKEETELLTFIHSIYQGEIQNNVRGMIKNREIDIYLPELKIAIEYNGLYWHSEKNGKMKEYHLDKLQKCQLKNIRLIQIFSDEWINKQDIVKSKIKNILNLEKNKIYARKCIIKKITPSDKNLFLEQHHIQGKCNSGISLGLYHKDELVAVMTFQKPRTAIGRTKNNIEKSYELVRFASKYNIIGGASKLLSFFIKNYHPNHIYSYSDNRWTDPNNNMYLKIGFKISSYSPPNYFYTKDFIKRYHRYNFNKGILKKKGADIKNKTEKQIMDEWGYVKIWDCGNTKYELFINNNTQPLTIFDNRTKSDNIYHHEKTN